MRLVNVAALYGMRLRAQLGQELLALVGIAVGVSLLFAALVANTSLTGSFERVTEAVVGDARLQVTARGQGIDDRVVEEVRRLPDVRVAAAVLEVRAEIRTPEGRRRSVLLIGADSQFVKLGGTLTRRFTYGFLADVRALALPTPMADDLGFALGQSLQLNIRGRVVNAPMGAKLQASDIGALIDSPFVVGPLRYVQELSGLAGQVSRISIVPRPGRTAEVERELKQRVRGANVHPADFDAALFRKAAQPTSQSTAIFSLFSALVGFLFAFSAVLLTVPERRRLVADLYAEGYGPRTALKILLFDALVLGAVGSGLGILLGREVSQRLFDEEPGFLGYAFAFDADQIVTLGSVVVAGMSGLVASCVAVLGPTIATVLGLGRDLEDRTAGRPIPVGLFAVAGLVLAIAGLALVAIASASAGPGFGGLALLTIGMLLLLPFTLRELVRLLDRITQGLRSIVPFLAIADLSDRATRARSLAVAATGAVAIFATVSLQGAHADLQRGLDRTSHDLATTAPLWVVPPGSANLLATTAFDPPVFRKPREIASITAYRSSFLDLGDRRVWVLGAPRRSVSSIAQGQLEDDEAALAERRLRSGGWAVVSEAVAREQRWDAGETFVLPSPRPLRLRLAARSKNLGWPPGAILLNADDYATAWGSSDVSALHAVPAPGVPSQAASAALARALAADPGLVVEASGVRERGQRAASRQGLSRMTQIAALVLVSAAIAMAAALAGMIWQRRTFFATMKVEGYGTSEMWGSLLLEAFVLIGAGCVSGAVFGLLGQRLLTSALSGVTGFPVVYSVAAAGALLSCVALTLITIAIVGAFGYRAAETPAARGVPG